MKTNDIKKGMRVKLRDGRIMTVQDNRRGNARTVEGPAIVDPSSSCIGDVYSWEFLEVDAGDGQWIDVELTEAQISRRDQSDRTGI